MGILWPIEDYLAASCGEWARYCGSIGRYFPANISLQKYIKRGKFGSGVYSA
jgi:hypothetical protein